MKETLEKLYKERQLIKQLMSLDYERYNYLNARSQEIKNIINTYFAPVPEKKYILFNIELSEKITKNAIELIEEL